MIRPDYLNEWEYFVYRHRSVGNILFHHLSLIGPVISIFMFFNTKNYYWLALIIATWPLGTLGHKIFEDGTVRGVDFIRLQTLTALFKVSYLMLKGTYAKEVEKVLEKTDKNLPLNKQFFTLK